MSQTTLDFDVTKRFHGGNPQSVLANQKARKGKAAASKRVLATIMGFGEASCEQIETHTGLSHQTCSARISELRRDGQIVKCGTAKTKSNCTCAVYRIL